MQKHKRFDSLAATFPRTAAATDADVWNTLAFKVGGTEHQPGLSEILPMVEEMLKHGKTPFGSVSVSAMIGGSCGRGTDSGDRHAIGISLLVKQGLSKDDAKREAKLLALRRGKEYRERIKEVYTSFHAAPKTEPVKATSRKAK